MPENTIDKNLVIDTFKAVYGSEKSGYGKWLEWFGITKGIMNTKFITLFAKWAAWSGEENLDKKQAEGKNPMLGMPDGPLVENFYRFLKNAEKNTNDQGEKDLIGEISAMADPRIAGEPKAQIIRGLRRFGQLFVSAKIQIGVGIPPVTKFGDFLKSIRNFPGYVNAEKNGQPVPAAASEFKTEEKALPLSTATEEELWGGIDFEFDNSFKFKSKKEEKKTVTETSGEEQKKKKQKIGETEVSVPVSDENVPTLIPTEDKKTPYPGTPYPGTAPSPSQDTKFENLDSKFKSPAFGTYMTPETFGKDISDKELSNFNAGTKWTLPEKGRMRKRTSSLPGLNFGQVSTPPKSGETRSPQGEGGGNLEGDNDAEQPTAQNTNPDAAKGGGKGETPAQEGKTGGAAKAGWWAMIFGGSAVAGTGLSADAATISTHTLLYSISHTVSAILHNLF